MYMNNLQQSTEFDGIGEQEGNLLTNQNEKSLEIEYPDQPT